MANDFDFFVETTKAAELLTAAEVKQGAELFAAAAVLAIAKGGLLTDLTPDNVAAVLPLGRSASARALRLLERHGFLVRSLRLAAGVMETNSGENTERNPFVVKNTPKNDGLEGEKCGKTPKSEDEEDEKIDIEYENGIIAFRFTAEKCSTPKKHRALQKAENKNEDGEPTA